MSRVVLDTDVASRSFKRQLPPSLLARLTGREPSITFVTQGELTKWALAVASFGFESAGGPLNEVFERDHGTEPLRAPAGEPGNDLTVTPVITGMLRQQPPPGPRPEAECDPPTLDPPRPEL